MKLSKETQIYLRDLIVCYEQKPHGSEVIFPNAPRKPCEEEKKYPSAEKYLLPQSCGIRSCNTQMSLMMDFPVPTTVMRMKPVNI